MNIIKLNAINSTNEYLKELLSRQFVDNFTVVCADNQTNGKGQMGAEWNSEVGKNLTFSVLVKDLLIEINDIFNLNVAVAVSITQALQSFNISEIAIKWPNDILAGNKKIGGVLIENSIKTNGEIFSIIGIGVNVNQKRFEDLPKASSLAVVANKEFDKDKILITIIEKLKYNIAKLRNNHTENLWKEYLKKLYKIGIPMPFEADEQKFMGIIKGVTKTGQLHILLEDDTMAEYEIKQIKLLY